MHISYHMNTNLLLHHHPHNRTKICNLEDRHYDCNTIGKKRPRPRLRNRSNNPRSGGKGLHIG